MAVLALFIKTMDGISCFAIDIFSFLWNTIQCCLGYMHNVQ